MKIAYVVDGRMPSERANGYQSAQMCQAFQENGVDLCLLYPNRRRILTQGITADTRVEEYYGLRAPLAQRGLPILDLIHPVQGLLGFSESSRPAMAAAVLTSYSFSFSLALHLRRHAFDLIYMRSVHALEGLIPLINREILARICFELHSLPKRPESVRRLIAALGAVGRIVTMTGHLKGQLVDLGLPPSRIAVAHDAVDLESFDLSLTTREARDRLGMPQDVQVASFVGKFHTNGEEKGIPEILAAAGMLHAEFPKLRFYFVGGPLDRVVAYREMIAKEGMSEDRFTFLDKQPVTRVPLYLKASDILLMPHPWSPFYAYQVSPLKMFEYMSARKPIVASALPSIQEILEDGVNSLLGAPGSPGDIAANIRKALADRSLSERVSSRAHVDVREHTWKMRAARILEFCGHA